MIFIISKSVEDGYLTGCMDKLLQGKAVCIYFMEKQEQKELINIG